MVIYILIKKAIYDENYNVLAYYDQSLGNKPDDEFTVDKAGTIYRTLSGEPYIVEAVELCDITDTEIADIKVVGKLSVNMLLGDELKVLAKAVNEKGAIIDAELEWISDQSEVASVNDGLITAQGLGNANITIKVKDKDISKNIKVNVIKENKPKLMYFKTRGGDNLKSITGYLGEGLPLARIYLEDQKGNFIDNQPIKWSIGDVSVLGSTLYQGDSNNKNIKYEALLSAEGVGETTLKASLENYPDISYEIPVKIKPARSERTWRNFKDEYFGKVDSEKNCYFVLDDEGKIFYTTFQNIYGLDSANGKELWNYTKEDEKIYWEKPQLDKEGNLYVYELYDQWRNKECKVYKFNKAGDCLKETDTVFQKIVSMQLGNEFVYVLTLNNKLYKFDKDLSEIWENPVDVGENNGILLASDKLYIAKEDTIYKISANGNMEEVYSDPKTRLSLEEGMDNGDILVQKNNLGEYSLLLIDGQGNVSWEYKELKTKVCVGIDKNEDIYAAEYSANLEKEIYFLDKNGEEKVKTIFTDRTEERGLKPVVANDGTVYIATTQINAFSAQGELLWQSKSIGTETGMYASIYYTPQSIAVDENNIVYVSSWGQGINTLKGKSQKGLQVAIKGKDSVALNTFKDLELEIVNHFDEQKDIDLKITLENIDSEKVLSETNFSDVIKSEASNNYMFGVKIPKEGTLQVKLEIVDRETNEILCRDEICLKK